MPTTPSPKTDAARAALLTAWQEEPEAALRLLGELSEAKYGLLLEAHAFLTRQLQPAPTESPGQAASSAA